MRPLGCFQLSTLVLPFRMIVCRGSLACGGSHLPPTGSGDLTVTSCMPPKVRFLDGVVCVLLCVGLNPCRLHVVLLS